MPYTAAIITVSDRSFRGEREDLSGPEAKKILEGWGLEVIDLSIVPDEVETISEKLAELVGREVDLIITSGGTGFAPRDVTPEATLKFIERLAPGISEAIRHDSLKKTPHAMLSRAVAGIKNKTLIINLPGSPKGVRESLEVIKDAIPHALEILSGRGTD